MSAVTISFSLQKGGVGKTTTCGLSAFLLNQLGFSVLAIDMDSQGNLTQLISGIDDLSVFSGETVKEALENNDIESYINVSDSENLHYVPADDYLVLINDYAAKNKSYLLKNAIQSVKNDYDFILIDTPPNLSIQTLNALMASDFVVIMFETAKFAYNAIPRFIETVKGIQKNGNTALQIAGILATLSDARRNDNKELLKLIRDDYGNLVFDSVIPRRASIGRLSVEGFFNNPEINQASKTHKKFVEEMIERVKLEKQIQQTSR